MLALADSTGFTLAQVCLWAVPALLAIRAGLRAPRGERSVWWIIASGSFVITTDKAIDLHGIVFGLGKGLIHTYAPGMRANGGRPLARLSLLGGLFAAGCGALYLLVRSDRAIGGPKRVSLLGLVLVMGYLGARLSPGLRDLITPSVGLVIEAVCWLLVVAGVAMGLRRPAEGPPDSGVRGGLSH